MRQPFFALEGECVTEILPRAQEKVDAHFPGGFGFVVESAWRDFEIFEEVLGKGNCGAFADADDADIGAADDLNAKLRELAFESQRGQ